VELSIDTLFHGHFVISKPDIHFKFVSWLCYGTVLDIVNCFVTLRPIFHPVWHHTRATCIYPLPSLLYYHEKHLQLAVVGMSLSLNQHWSDFTEFGESDVTFSLVALSQAF
jgi:hypothetical protein